MTSESVQPRRYKCPSNEVFSVTKCGKVFLTSTGEPVKLIRTKRGGFLTNIRGEVTGYKYMNVRVSQLLASTFIANPERWSDVGFHDGDKFNISLDNLYWKPNNSEANATVRYTSATPLTEEQFIALYEGLYPKMVRALHKGARTIEDTEDLVQDIFTEIWAKRHRYNPKYSPAKFALLHMKSMNSKVWAQFNRDFGKTIAFEDLPLPEGFDPDDIDPIDRLNMLEGNSYYSAAVDIDDSEEIRINREALLQYYEQVPVLLRPVYLGLIEGKSAEEMAKEQGVRSPTMRSRVRLFFEYIERNQGG